MMWFAMAQGKLCDTGVKPAKYYVSADTYEEAKKLVRQAYRASFRDNGEIEVVLWFANNPIRCHGRADHESHTR